jgi:four helix bundle protein
VNDFGPTRDLTARAKHFAIRVIQMCGKLPRTPKARVIGTQTVRSAASVAANYRAACRARSRAEFIAKLGIVVEEADETVFWLELLTESGIVPQGHLVDLAQEVRELLAIFSASRRTAKSRKF